MNKQVLKLAIPNILSNITIPLLSSVDIILMGHGNSTTSLAAIAIGTAIFNFIYWGFGFLRMGTTGLTAQAHGAKDEKMSTIWFWEGLLMALVIGILLFLFQVPIKSLAFYFINDSPDAVSLAERYFDIRIFAAPVTIASYVMVGWLLGRQNAVFPLIIAICANVLNIGFSYYFVHSLKMDVEGVALGTVIAQYIGFIVALCLVFSSHSKELFKVEWKSLLNKNYLLQFFNLNKDIFLRTLCLILTFTFFTFSSANESDTIVAANTILMNLLMILSYGVDGFAFAAESLVGKYFGEKNMQKVKQVIRICFAWSLVSGVLFLIFWIINPSLILEQFTDKIEVIEAALTYKYWFAVLPLVSVGAFIMDGVFVGAMFSKEMRNSMFLATVFYFIIYYTLYPMIGNLALWIAMISYMGGRAIVQLIISKNRKII